MFFICTLHASKVIFVTFNLNCGLHIFSVGKTVCVDVKFLDGSNFLYPKPNCIFIYFCFPHTPNAVQSDTEQLYCSNQT